MNRNLRGYISLLTALISIIFLIAMRELIPQVFMGISVFMVLSISGILFALSSKQLRFIIPGVFLNLGVLTFAYFLLFGVGIGGT